MSKRIAKRLFEIRHRFPKLRGAPTFAEPTWETIGEDAQRAFIDFAGELGDCDFYTPMVR